MISLLTIEARHGFYSEERCHLLLQLIHIPCQTAITRSLLNHTQHVCYLFLHSLCRILTHFDSLSLRKKSDHQFHFICR